MPLSSPQEVWFVKKKKDKNEISYRDVPQDFMSFNPHLRIRRGSEGLVSLFPITMAALFNMRLRLLSL